jgi:DNA-binding response OmpR family regulator
MKGKSALIVDDEEDICRLLGRFLNRSFQNVEFALNLKDGLACARHLRPDLLILDNNLPDGIGIQMIKEFRMYCDFILVISAMGNLQEQALQAGADYFLPKPVSFSDIEEILKIKKTSG